MCEDVLERTSGRSLRGALACSLTALILWFPANFLSLMTIRGPAGLVSTTHLFGGCVIIWRLGWPLMAAVLTLEGIVLPFFRFGLLAATLIAVRRGGHGRWVGRCFRWSERLDEWAMPDVFLLAGAIGYGRVAALIPVRIDAGGYALVAGALMAMLTRGTLDRRAVWRRIATVSDHLGWDAVACTRCDLLVSPRLEGGHCPRCAARLHRRKPFSFIRTAALTLAGFALLPLANLYPLSIFYKEGVSHPQTIFIGVQLLFQNGYAPLGVLIFVTSIGFPVTKLVALFWFLVSIYWRSSQRLRFKTKLYRFVSEIGRWSNLDPFTLVIFTPMVQFGQVAHFGVGGGGPAFLAMVVISMFATDAFDPRLLWDIAARRRGSR